MPHATQANSIRIDRPVIAIEGHRLDVRPVPQCLERLRIRTLTVRDGQEHAGVLRTGTPLVPPPFPLATGGLLDVVEHLLNREGITYERVHDVRFPKLDPPKLENIPQHRPPDPALLQVLRHRCRGLVRYGRCDLSWFFAQAVQSYPDATFAVVTSCAGDRDAIAAGLVDQQLDVTVVEAAHRPDRVGRVVVSTWYGLGHSEIESWRRTFLLVPHAVDAISSRAQDVLLQPDSAFRLFGFLSTDQRLSARERDLLACVFGLDELVIPKHGCVARPVGVAWRRFRHRTVRDTNRSLAERKATHLWGNHQRNRLIAGIARTLASERPSQGPAEHRRDGSL